MTCRVDQKVDGNRHPYEVTAVWDPKRKNSRRKRKYPGKCDADGNLPAPKEERAPEVRPLGRPDAVTDFFIIPGDDWDVMPDQIADRLYQFSEVVGRMDLPMHQYLLASEPSVMFATGSYDQAEWILPEVAEILGDRPLKYLFLSHFESDECGGIRAFRKRYPRITVVCSSFLAHELPGFGYTGRIVVGEEGKGFDDGELSFKFFRYPAEVHLRDGLLCYERNSGVFYSSDLMFRQVSGKEKAVDGDWRDEVASVDAGRIPDEVRRERLKADLLKISPRLVAVGHGTCVRCAGERFYIRPAMPRP